MKQHWPALDGLRAVAIGLVLWQHAGLLFGDRGIDLGHWFWRASRAGWWGVDLFFVLSGLLITRLLLRPAATSLGTFWRRRAARTMPLLYVYLVAAAAYGFGGGFAVTEQPWLAYLTHTANLHIASAGFGLPVFGMLWSLGVEEQFYLAWPLAVRGARSRLGWLCGVLLVVAPLARWGVYHASDSYAAFHVLPLCRCDTLALGALLALALEHPPRWAGVARLSRALLAPALAVLGLVTAWGLGPWPLPAHEEAWVVGGYSLVGLSCATVVAAAATGGAAARWLLGNPLMAHLGRVSYGIYLWHCLLALCVLSLPSTASVEAQLGLWLAAVVGVATLSWLGIERRWLQPVAPA